MSTLTLFGNTIDQAVQHITDQAWSKHTAQAMLEASQKLHGISTFLIFQSDNVQAFSKDLIKIVNERARCERAAEMIEQGKL